MLEEEKIKIFMVDDSPVARDFLTYIFASDPALKVIGYADNGQEALHWLKYQDPDVISMDITMPILDGFETARRIMQTKPVPIVIVSGDYKTSDSARNFEAIASGALAIVEKPNGIYDTALIQTLLETIHTISGCKLIKRHKDPPLPSTTIPWNKLTAEKIEHPEHIAAIAIGASLGGPLALETIFSQLPGNLSAPIFLVQHISHGFTKGFASWLQRKTSLRVEIARDRQKALPGSIYIPPDGALMSLQGDSRIALEFTEAIHLKPSIDKLFLSIAKIYGPNSMGILLTGMGRDGAMGLLQMKQKGAITIAQNEESCVIFGMPREAIKLGGVKRVLSLEAIVTAILQMAKSSTGMKEIL